VELPVGQELLLAVAMANGPLARMLEIVTGAALPLLTPRVSGDEVCPATTPTELKSSEVWLTVSVPLPVLGLAPEPMSATSPGGVPLEATCRLAVLAPVEPGTKVTTTVQLVDAASDAPALQVELEAKANEDASAPATPSELSVTAPGPLFTRVRLCDALLTPTTVEAKLSAVVLGCQDSTGMEAVVPQPVSTMELGELRAFVVMRTDSAELAATGV